MSWSRTLIFIDVNVLVYAHRKDVARHDEYAAWLKRVLNSESAFGISDLVLSGFVRVVTHRRVFADPTPLEVALRFVRSLRDRDNAVPVVPGARHWNIFERLCRDAEARGNLVADAYFAALAIESGVEWITTDRDFARFTGLRWRHPLA